MKRPVLGVDVDSTVWDLAEWVCDAVLEVTGEPMDRRAITTWTRILDVYGEEAAIEIHERALSPERVHERIPYPGCPEVLRRIQQERGFHIHFVTRNWNPAAMSPRLEPWLRGHFGHDVELTVTDQDKLPILHGIGAFGMIDDHPDIISRVAEAGLWAAAMLQPWNRGLTANRNNIYTFADWREVPRLLPDSFPMTSR